MNKKPFYIFTGHIGVFCDNKSIVYSHGPFANSVEYPVLKKESVNAFNSLVDALEENYDTKIVATSSLRKDLPRYLEYLKYNGIKYDKDIFATEVANASRGEKILNVMKQDNLEPDERLSLKDKIKAFFSQTEQKNSFKDYVVIDCMTSRLTGIPRKNIIATSLKRQSLTQKQVSDFLSSLQPQPGNE